MDIHALLSRLFKPFLLAGLMFWSVLSLGAGVGVASAAASCPLILGLLNVFTTFTYQLSALVFLSAIAVKLLQTSAAQAWMDNTAGWLTSLIP